MQFRTNYLREMIINSIVLQHAQIQMEQGSLLKNHKKNIEFLSNTGPDPLNNQRATEPAFNCGPIVGPLFYN